MIREKFEQAKNTPSDINEHMETLLKYGQQCNHITEFGVRNVVSTWAWLMAEPQKLICYDIHKTKELDIIVAGIEWTQKGVMKGGKFTSFNFIEADVLKVEIEPTELLFVDTLHVYTQLKQELALHAKNVSKYIIFHDVVTYGYKPEPSSWQTPEIMKNYKENDTGIMQAIKEFLSQNKNWKIKDFFKNNNGLMVIEKNG
jgi:hypothetical protein